MIIAKNQVPYMSFFGTEVDIALYLDSFSLEIVVKCFILLVEGKKVAIV